MGASYGLLALAVATLLLSPTRFGFSVAIALLALDMLLWIVCTIRAWRLAKGVGANYQLKDYNRWYVYALLLLIGVCGTALGFAFVLHERVVQAFVILTSSMVPTINSGGRIVTLKEVFLDRDSERGELVVFRNPEQRRHHWIKRVIAVAGDEVEWRDNGELLVNGTLLKRTAREAADEWAEENGSRHYAIPLGSEPVGGALLSGDMIVPLHHCFALGDNRFVSKDSRTFGPVAYSALTARPVAKVWGGLGARE